MDTGLASVPATLCAMIMTSGSHEGLPTKIEGLEQAQAYLTGMMMVWIMQILWTIFFIALIYGIGSVISEGGPRQSTWGKRFLGLEVVDMEGRGLSYGEAALRFAAGTLSWITLNIGHGMASFRSDKRALHDLVAGAQVVMGPMDQRMGRALGCIGIYLACALLPMLITPSDPLLEQAINMMMSGIGAYT